MTKKSTASIISLSDSVDGCDCSSLALDGERSGGIDVASAGGIAYWAFDIPGSSWTIAEDEAGRDSVARTPCSVRGQPSKAVSARERERESCTGVRNCRGKSAVCND